MADRSTDPDGTRHAHARRMLVVAMLIAPLTITAVAVVVMLFAGGDLGREVAIHWNGAGPDGWGPAWTYPVVLAAIGIAMPVLMWVSAARTSRVGGATVFLAGLMIWLTAFLGIALTASLVLQPEDIGWWFLIAAAGGALLAAPAWLWLPREPATAADPAELDPVDLSPGQVAVWSRRAFASRTFTIVIALAVILTLGLAIFATVTTEGAAWVAFIAPVIVIAAYLLTAGWRVTAGPTGLTVRGLAGIPVFRVAIADIAEAAVVRVEPMADFGGWGIRWTLTSEGKGSTGIVTRAGEALQVTRTDGRQLAVTVDDAATGAAVLHAHRTTPTPTPPTA